MAPNPKPPVFGFIVSKVGSLLDNRYQGTSSWCCWSENGSVVPWVCVRALVHRVAGRESVMYTMLLLATGSNDNVEAAPQKKVQ